MAAGCTISSVRESKMEIPVRNALRCTDPKVEIRVDLSASNRLRLLESIGGTNLSLFWGRWEPSSPRIRLEPS